jgi:transcriptional regulator with XRE-family HTH domain
MSDHARAFGLHVRSLRRARGITQDALAVRSGLSPDTIRRVEKGAFSASLDTLRKLCGGLGVAESTLFESFEIGRTDARRELFDLIAGCDDATIALITSIVRVTLVGLADLRAALKG